MGEMIGLRIVHVIGGMFWVGSALFNQFYLFPALAAAGPGAGAIMASMQRRRLFVVLPVVALLTILSGLRLIWITSGGFAPGYFETGRGATFAGSGGLAILAFLIGVFFARPAGVRLGTLRQSLAGAPESARAALAAEADGLQRRMATLSQVVNTLLILAAAGMAAGRYVP